MDPVVLVDQEAQEVQEVQGGPEDLQHHVQGKRQSRPRRQKARVHQEVQEVQTVLVVQVGQEDPGVREVRADQEDPVVQEVLVVLEGPVGLEDQQHSLLEYQQRKQHQPQTRLEAPEDQGVLGVQAVLGDQVVQADQEAPVDQVVPQVRTCYWTQLLFTWRRQLWCRMHSLTLIFYSNFYHVSLVASPLFF